MQVYKITNKINNKIYIGITSNILGKRIASYKSAIKMAGWNKDTKGVCKANSSSFKTGSVAPNRGRKKVIIDGKIRYIKIEAQNVI